MTLPVPASPHDNAPDLGFTYRATAHGNVHISRAGREVTVLRSGAAAKFLAKAEGASVEQYSSSVRELPATTREAMKPMLRRLGVQRAAMANTPSSPASWTRAGRCCGAASPTR